MRPKEPDAAAESDPEQTITRPDDSRFATRRARANGITDAVVPATPRPDESSFASRKPAADATNAATARRRLVSLGTTTQWVQQPGRNGDEAPMREIEFEDLFDIDSGGHFRRFRDNPNVLVPMARTTEGDRVRHLGTFNLNASTGRSTSPPDTTTPAHDSPNW